MSSPSTWRGIIAGTAKAAALPAVDLRNWRRDERVLANRSEGGRRRIEYLLVGIRRGRTVTGSGHCHGRATIMTNQRPKRNQRRGPRLPRYVDPAANVPAVARDVCWPQSVARGGRPHLCVKRNSRTSAGYIDRGTRQGGPTSEEFSRKQTTIGRATTA